MAFPSPSEFDNYMKRDIFYSTFNIQMYEKLSI